ncbi:MAG: DivIVA domain-containing protein, partial [Actinobacteria bacterium]|nr:DivIVA domain-containing protein [Actinomycetota bacterium]
MELTPQLLTDEIDFRIAVRGYDRNEVGDFLERVAVAVGQLQTQLAKAVARARTAEARVSELEAAGPGATTDIAADDRDRLPADEPEVVAEPVDDAGDSDVADDATSALPTAPPAAPVPVIGDDDDLNEELRRTLVLAQRTADMAIREAHDEAKAIIDRANDEARHNREEAEAAHAKAREEARARLVAEIRELETTRESMRDDAAVLERHLGTERARVRETIQVLRRLVDDPASFRTGGLPELSGVTTPAELGPGSGSIDDPVGEEVDAANEIDDSEVDAPAAVDAPADAPVDTRGTSSEPTIGRARFD